MNKIVKNFIEYISSREVAIYNFLTGSVLLIGAIWLFKIKDNAYIAYFLISMLNFLLSFINYIIYKIKIKKEIIR